MSSKKMGLRRVGIVGLSTLLATTMMAGVASANSTFAFTRIAGVDRWATSVATAQQFGPSTDVIVANGENGHYPDALTANYLAGAKHAPILLTQAAATPANIAAQIAASGATHVWIIGGTTVVSAAQEATLASSYTVTRLGGADRWATAAQVMGAVTATGHMALLARGDNFPDAIAGGALSYAKGMPLAITQSNTLTPSTLAALQSADITSVLVLGGTDAISQGVVDSLAANGITLAHRFAGADRAETSSLLADYEITNQGFSDTAVNVASGYVNGGGADALGGSALSGQENRPLLITDSNIVAGAAVDAFLVNHAPTLASGFIFGGLFAISQALQDSMTAAATTANQTFTVTAYTGGSSMFTYADPATGTSKTATFSSTDVFTVDGVTATEASFMSNLSVGDQVTIMANTPTTGVTTYQLVNKVPADYTSGLVGDWVPGTSISIVDPVTGTVLDAFAINGGFTVFTVDGTTVSEAVMEGGLNPGDTVSYTGTGVDASHIRTVAVTSKVLTGTVSHATATTFRVDTAAGATLPPWAITPTNVDTLTVDGVAVTLAVFNANVSNGDTVAYSRLSGNQVIALTNKAPLSIHGQITMANLPGNTFSYIPDGDGSVTEAGLPAGIVLTVDGVVATAVQFDTAFTLGDTVVYRAADTTTSTTASLALTNANFSGTVDKTNTTTTGINAHVGVWAAGSSTVQLGQVQYVAGHLTNGLTGTPVYTVNGAPKTVGEFETALGGIVGGTLTGTIIVSQGSGTATFALTTAIA